MKRQHQTYTYKKILNEILQHIKRKFSSGNDIAKSLRTGTVKTFREPTLWTTGMRTKEREVEILITPAKILREGDELQPDEVRSEMIEVVVAILSEEDKINFKIDYKMYVKEKKLYKDNMIKAYATIFDYCSSIVQQCIWELSNYTKIINDPITLLAAIQELTHSTNKGKILICDLNKCISESN